MSVNDDPQVPPADAEPETARDEPTADTGPQKDGKPQVIIKATSCFCGTHEPTYDGVVVKFSSPHSDEELLELARQLCRTVPGMGTVMQDGNDTIVVRPHELLTTDDVRALAEGIAQELGVDPDDIQEEIEDGWAALRRRFSPHGDAMVAAIFGGSYRPRQHRRPTLWDIFR